jgi:PEP-CTERM motif
MSKRSFLFPLALGLLVNLAFVTSSQAGSTVITVDSILSNLSSQGITSVTGVDITFSGVPTLNDLTLVTPLASTGATIIASNNDTVAITIPTAVSDAYVNVFYQAFATFTFVVAGNGLNVSVNATDWHTNRGVVKGQSSVLLDPSVPEPASMSLLGIGMAGLFAFRRYFKRTANVRS